MVVNIKDLVKWPDDGVSSIPYQIYTDPEVYDEEQKRIFRGPIWSFVGIASEIPKPGDYQTTYIGDTPVIVLRDMNSQIQVIVNRCAHRGNLVCIAKEGNTEALTCVYHNWRYDLQGNLKSVAFGKGVGKQGGMPDDFDQSKNGMQRLKSETYAELIFASFSDDVTPLQEWLGEEMVDNIDRVVGRGMTLLGTYSQYMPNNWKLYMENVRDSYHASILHMFQATFRLNRLSMKGGIKMSHGGWHHISYSIAEADREESEYDSKKLRAVKDGYTLADPSLVKGWREFDCGTTLAIQSTYPNFVVQQISNSLALRLCLPKGPEECELLWWVFGAPEDTEEQRNIRVKQSNMIGPGGVISMEDGVVGGWIQRGTKRDQGKSSVVLMGGRGIEPSGEGRATEVSIRGFWQGYRDCMGV
jgi:anthranilate 1,2-dioxygenase large subunit/terephthalate 1,2-dioxygenase oxygenase component alpha subunit